MCKPYDCLSRTFNIQSIFGFSMKRTLVLASWATAVCAVLAILTGCGGGSAMQTAPPASITSFSAASSSITDGTSTTLVGVFSGGTGVITPGNIAASSGAAVTVSPATTTAYTLTVTPSGGGGIATASATVTVDAAPTITSFTASPGSISVGQSATLTGVFANGTGVITPGNLAVTSGTPVTITPTATTVYTLTVTNPSGTAIALTATIKVNTAPPAISSFVAAPATIPSGATSSLTAVFANGTGVITPGSFSITSGTPVSVNPVATTTYTLTVTPASGTPVTANATVTVATSIVVDESSLGPPVTDQLLGMNMAVWYDPTTPAIQTGFSSVGVTAVRWPGGSDSDIYNWEDGTVCDGYANPKSDFTTFVTNFVLPSNVDLALTADYGTGRNCTGAGDPTEASAWVAEAETLGVTVSHMTVGNEVYGKWEFDNHSAQHDPVTYAAAVAGANGYYALVKAASPTTLVGVDVNAGAPAIDDVTANWDPVVLANAPYDFVEYHFYPQDPGSESDNFLVHQAAQGITVGINTIKAELAAAGHPDIPIYVGETGSVSSNPGKQTWSITQGLFAGQLLGEMMNDGISRATWWIGYGNCNGSTGNLSSSLYGWQDFGAYNIFSDGPSDSTCPGAGPIGTLSPTAIAYQLFSHIAISGENVLPATVAGDATDIRAYAATNQGGTALLLFNLNENTAQPVQVALSGQAASAGVTVITYDKSLYDQSGSPTGTFPDPNGSNIWALPTTTSLGAQALPMTLNLTPWSVNVVIIK
jgi:hypothetical protein